MDLSFYKFLFYIILIIEVHNLWTNKLIRLIKDLVPDISNIGPLFEFHSTVFSISEIRGLEAFFLHWP